jgi:hypothetical protein
VTFPPESAMPNRSTIVTYLLFAMFVCRAGSASATVEVSCLGAINHGEPDTVAQAIAEFTKTLSDAQRATLERPLTHENAIGWSNLPIGVVPRKGLRLGDLDEQQTAAAKRVFAAAFSACGNRLLDEVRLADDYLVAFDKRSMGWDGRNYYLSVLGSPGANTPWMLQVGGHHLSYNLTFNGRQPGATPLFFGTEPIRFTIGESEHEPLTVQSTAMSNLAQAVSGYPEAKLSGTFTDVVKGVQVEFVPNQRPRGGIDTGFPHQYPTGERDRGVPYSRLDAEQRRHVLAAIESYASLPDAAISKPLLDAYESPDALARTYVGYSGATDLSAKGSYVRIDGPRIWMEFVVQPAVAKPEELHYHALWRDKQADYGGEVGGH